LKSQTIEVLNSLETMYEGEEMKRGFLNQNKPQEEESLKNTQDGHNHDDDDDENHGDDNDNDNWGSKWLLPGEGEEEEEEEDIGGSWTRMMTMMTSTTTSPPQVEEDDDDEEEEVTCGWEKAKRDFTRNRWTRFAAQSSFFPTAPTSTTSITTNNNSSILPPPTTTTLPESKDETPFCDDVLQGPLKDSPRQVLMSRYGKHWTTTLTDASFFTWHDSGPAHARKFMCLFLCPITYERFASGRYHHHHHHHHHADSHNNNNNNNNNKDLLLLGETITMENVITTTGNGVVVAATAAAAAWHTQKKRAEHGAAARAYDCFIYRERITKIHNRFAGVPQDLNKTETSSNQNDNDDNDDRMNWHDNHENDNNSNNNKKMQQALANVRHPYLGAEIPYATPDEGPIVIPPPEVEAAIQAQMQHWKNVRKDKKRQRQDDQMLLDEEVMLLEEEEQGRQDYRQARVC
jgi:hypothetical protein